MTRLLLVLPPILCAVLSGCGLAHIPAQEDSASLTIRWEEDFDAARTAAASSHRPILAVLVAGPLKDKC